MSTVISHDAFARTSFLRERIYNPSCNCAQCGGLKVTPKELRPYLFDYWVQREDTRKEWRWVGNRLFCSVECYRSFYS